MGPAKLDERVGHCIDYAWKESVEAVKIVYICRTCENLNKHGFYGNAPREIYLSDFSEAVRHAAERGSDEFDHDVELVIEQDEVS